MGVPTSVKIFSDDEQENQEIRDVLCHSFLADRRPGVKGFNAPEVGCLRAQVRYV